MIILKRRKIKLWSILCNMKKDVFILINIYINNNICADFEVLVGRWAICRDERMTLRNNNLMSMLIGKTKNFLLTSENISVHIRWIRCSYDSLPFSKKEIDRFLHHFLNLHHRHLTLTYFAYCQSISVQKMRVFSSKIFH